MPEPPKQESTPQLPTAQAAEKPETAPEPVGNVIPLHAESKQPSESKAADEEPIEFNSQRDNMYATKVTLGGDRLRKYFPDVSMKPIEIVESIYSALEDRRQRRFDRLEVFILQNIAHRLVVQLAAFFCVAQALNPFDCWLEVQPH